MMSCAIRRSRLLFSFNIIFKNNQKLMSHYILLKPLCRTLKSNKTTFERLKSNVRSNVILSDIGEGIVEVELKEWFVKLGDKIKEFDPICEVKSDKASVTITSRYEGKVLNLYGKIGDTVKIGSILAELCEDTDNSRLNFIGNLIQNESLDVCSSIKNSLSNTTFIKVSPLVRKYATEHDLDLSIIQKQFPSKIITLEDLVKYEIESSKPGVNNGFNVRNSNYEAPNKNDNETTETIDDEVIPWNSQRISMFKTMTASLEIPHLVYSDDINVDKVLKKIKEIKSKDFEIYVNFFSYLVKAISESIKINPLINSILTKKKNDSNCRIDEKYQFIRKRQHNFGIAIDAGKYGLSVGVIKSVQNLNVSTISKEILRLKELALDDRLKESDIGNPTFTISNIGSIGGNYLKPIILAPQVAIIAVGKLKSCAYDQTTLLPISIAADHRVIDGATVARFCENLKKSLENDDRCILI